MKITSDMFKNLRAGPVVRAVGSNESTVRAWFRNNGLKLSDARDDPKSRPIYNLADTARLFIMTILTKRLNISATIAAVATNHASLIIEGLAASELLRIDDVDHAYPDQWMLCLGSLDGTMRPEVLLADIVRERGFILAEALIDLRMSVRLARDDLANQLQIPVFELPQDFK